MLGCEKNSERIWWTGYGNYAGLLDHGNFGPCLVWNNAVTCFAAPSYYMQKMLFTDNQGSHVVPFTHNTVNCYWSATIDSKSPEKGLLIKVANNKETSETVNISVKGADHIDPAGNSTTLKGAPDAENSISNPLNLFPVAGTFKASGDFDYTFPAYSVTVLRINY
jgi:alpha-L-arabinofuranosidase